MVGRRGDAGVLSAGVWPPQRQEEALLVQLCPAIWKKQQETTFTMKVKNSKIDSTEVFKRKGMCIDVCNFVMHQK